MIGATPATGSPAGARPVLSTMTRRGDGLGLMTNMLRLD
jgi:hypothetical protein